MNILRIDSSVSGEKSVSRQLTKATAHELMRRSPNAMLTTRDLVATPLRHYTAVVRLFDVATAQLSAEQQEELQTGDDILDEFLRADVVVVGAPMYNFSIPSQLKAWIDLICVPGKTFRYSATGPEGLCAGKWVIIVSSRGGMYGPGSPAAAFDFQENYLRATFIFLGIADVDIVRAEGIALGADKAAAAIEGARRDIVDLRGFRLPMAA